MFVETWLFELRWAHKVIAMNKLYVTTSLTVLYDTAKTGFSV